MKKAKIINGYDDLNIDEAELNEILLYFNLKAFADELFDDEIMYAKTINGKTKYLASYADKEVFNFGFFSKNVSIINFDGWVFFIELGKQDLLQLIKKYKKLRAFK